METQDSKIDDSILNKTDAWHALKADETLAQFDTPVDSGLSDVEAARRKEYYGSNQLAEAPPTTIWQMCCLPKKILMKPYGIILKH